MHLWAHETEIHKYKNSSNQNRILILKRISLREKCPYSELFWSKFSRIQTEYRKIWSTTPYAVRIRENTDQKKLRTWTFFTQYLYFSNNVKYYFALVISSHSELCYLQQEITFLTGKRSL